MENKSVSQIIWKEAARCLLMFVGLCVVYYLLHRTLAWDELLLQAIGAICFVDGLPALKNLYDRHSAQ